MRDVEFDFLTGASSDEFLEVIDGFDPHAIHSEQFVANLRERPQRRSSMIRGDFYAT